MDKGRESKTKLRRRGYTGYMTNYFKISRGMRQGCPLSPFLFILAVELLASKIRQLQDCKGIPLPNHQEVKISQFADDTTLIMSDTNSLKFALQTIDNFGTVSGLKLNKKKPKRCGSAPQDRKILKYWNLVLLKTRSKYLEHFYLSHNLDKNINANFYLKIRKMSTKLNLWRARELTLYGKSLLAKTLGASQLIYTASMICVPDTVINNVQGKLFSFLWNNRKDKVKRKVMYQPLSEGGINFINFRTMVNSLRLAWIQRLLTNSYDAWKAIPKYFFNKYGGLAFLLKCNFDSAKLDKNLPLFYRELLDYFQELTNNSQYITNDLILWNNKNLTVDKKCLFWKSWFDRGIYFIGDLLNSA